MADETFIRTQIRRILFEETESTEAQSPPESTPQSPDQKRGKIARVKPGRGRVKAQIEEAEALANSNPGELMEKLKITSAPGDTAIKKVAYVLKVAVETLKSTQGLEDAYDRIAVKKNEEGIMYLHIIPKDISNRDALLYMNHALVGAVNAEILKDLDKIVVPEIKDGKAVINFKDL